MIAHDPKRFQHGSLEAFQIPASSDQLASATGILSRFRTPSTHCSPNRKHVELFTNPEALDAPTSLCKSSLHNQLPPMEAFKDARGITRPKSSELGTVNRTNHVIHHVIHLLQHYSIIFNTHLRWFPKMGVHPVIIHCCLGFSMEINHPFLGSPIEKGTPIR